MRILAGVVVMVALAESARAGTPDAVERERRIAVVKAHVDKLDRPHRFDETDVAISLNQLGDRARVEIRGFPWRVWTGQRDGYVRIGNITPPPKVRSANHGNGWLLFQGTFTIGANDQISGTLKPLPVQLKWW